MKIGIITFHAAMNYGSVLNGGCIQDRYLSTAFTMPSGQSAAFFVTGRKSGSWPGSRRLSVPLLPVI